MQSLSPLSVDSWPLTLHYLNDFVVANCSSAFIRSSNATNLLTNLFMAMEDDRITGSHGYSTLPTSLGNSYLPSLRHSRRLHNENSPNFILDLVMVFVCIICAGFASGLTQGLLSLDFTKMKIKSRSGTVDEKKYASKVIPVIKRHHLLLVTLMLWNATATEALPIFLAGLVNEYAAIIISVTLVLFAGEIIPAAILTGPNQLKIAANLIPLVYVVHFVFFPIAYPISLILDCWLGHDEGITVYNRKEIATMMNIQHEEGKGRNLNGGSLQLEEMNIIDGALKFRDMLVRQAMTPVCNVYMLSSSERLSYKVLSEIFKSGYSRIPVYGVDKHDIVGLILTKDLIFLDPDDEVPVTKFIRLFGRQPVVVWHDHKLGETLTNFRKGRSHMAVVRDINNSGPGDPFYEVIGIITLEDIIEEIIGVEIEDETDYNTAYVDADRMAKRDRDIARLQLLDSKDSEEFLSSVEVEEVTTHLIRNVSQIQELLGPDIDRSAVRQLVHTSMVLDISRKSMDSSKPGQEDILYKRGRRTNSCTLLLQGELAVLTGREAVRSDIGPLDVLAADALVQPDGSYVPDFTAYIVSDSVRVLCMSIHTADASQITKLQDKKGEKGISTTTLNSRLAHGDRRRMLSSEPTLSYLSLPISEDLMSDEEVDLSLSCNGHVEAALESEDFITEKRDIGTELDLEAETEIEKEREVEVEVEHLMPRPPTIDKAARKREKERVKEKEREKERERAIERAKDREREKEKERERERERGNDREREKEREIERGASNSPIVYMEGHTHVHQAKSAVHVGSKIPAVPLFSSHTSQQKVFPETHINTKGNNPIGDLTPPGLTPAERYSFNLKRKEKLNRIARLNRQSTDSIPLPRKQPENPDDLQESQSAMQLEGMTTEDIALAVERERKAAELRASLALLSCINFNVGDGKAQAGMLNTPLASTAKGRKLSTSTRPSKVTLSRGSPADGKEIYDALSAYSMLPDTPPGAPSLFRSFPNSVATRSPGTPNSFVLSSYNSPDSNTPREPFLSMEGIYSNPEEVYDNNDYESQSNLYFGTSAGTSASKEG